MPIKFFICGDIVITQDKNAITSKDLEYLIKSSDVAICNFEGPLESEGKPIPKVGPHISQHVEALKIVEKTGFTHCSLANNHIYDYGEIGLHKTLDVAEENSLEILGAGKTWDEAYALKLYEADDMRIGMLAYCEAEFGCLLEDEGRGGYAYINHGSVYKRVMEARKYVDILIIIVHAGAEDVPLPLPEWRERYRELCDLGADAVIAHHPHVPQGWEEYNGKLIFYSLGNFYFDWESFKISEDYAYSVIIEVENKHITGFQIIPHKKVGGLTTMIDEQTFNDELKRLSEMLGGGYKALANKQAIMLYENRYKPYYITALSGMDRRCSFFKKIILIIRQLFSRSNNNEAPNELLLLHNVRIDSHRYSAQRALSLLREKK